MEEKIVELETKLARLEKIVLCLADLIPTRLGAQLLTEICEEHMDDIDPLEYEAFLSDYKNEET